MSNPNYKVGPVQQQGKPGIKIWAPDLEACHIRIFFAEDSYFPSSVHEMIKDDDGLFSFFVTELSDPLIYDLQLPSGKCIPDPYALERLYSVHGLSKTSWKKPSSSCHPWKGIRSADQIMLEVHIGTFTQEGTFKACEEKLGHIKEAGFNTIQLMPITSTPGLHNWGYDVVSFFTLNPNYGSVEDLNHLVFSAHEMGIAVIFDAVFNHFGPEGNYTGLIASDFQSTNIITPWGPAIGLDSDHAEIVADILYQSVAYWMENFKFDGIRIDAAEHLFQFSSEEIISKIFRQVSTSCDHNNPTLILEGDENSFPKDQIMHLYKEFPEMKIWNRSAIEITKPLEASPIDEKLKSLVINLFEAQESKAEVNSKINFVRSHDTIGNINLQKRNQFVRRDEFFLYLAIVIIAPGVPMLFMGDDWFSDSPFYFFCDLKDISDTEILHSRRQEFHSSFDLCPAPNSKSAFLQSKLNWDELQEHEKQSSLAITKKLIKIRKKVISPFYEKGIVNTKYNFNDSGLNICITNGNLEKLSISILSDYPLPNELHLTEHVRLNITQ